MTGHQAMVRVLATLAMEGALGAHQPVGVLTERIVADLASLGFEVVPVPEPVVERATD